MKDFIKKYVLLIKTFFSVKWVFQLIRYVNHNKNGRLKKVVIHPRIGDVIKVVEDDFKMVGRVLTVDDGSTNGLFRGKATYISSHSDSSGGELEFCTYKQNDSWCYMANNRFIGNPTTEELDFFLLCESKKEFIEKVFVFETTKNKFEHRFING